MKKVLLAGLVMFLFFSFGTVNSSAQGTKNVFSQKVEKSRGENPNIKEADICNIPDKEAADPAASRGAYCTINVDNWTGYIINVWVDGNYKGTVSAYGEGIVTVGSGWTKIYCETTGGTYYWSDEGGCDGYVDFDLRK